MTSVAAYDYRSNTVAFVGTRNGKLKKVSVSFRAVCVSLLFPLFFTGFASPRDALAVRGGV